VNLAQPPREGRSLSIGEGMLVDLSSLTLQIERPNLLDIYNRQAQPIFSVEVVKEMFPGLFSDPYSHRVHRLGGFDDFNRGTLTDLRAMEVEGVPTLVSVGGVQESRWRSAVYKMPRPLIFDAAVIPIVKGAAQFIVEVIKIIETIRASADKQQGPDVQTVMRLHKADD
jgi:hypothetical protein